MKTIQAIVELATGNHAGREMAMATVVNVRGSAYRRPGARMFIAPDGRAVGTISGGCLENDVREHAAAVMACGEPRVVTYDTTSPDDIVFGLGLGCNGIVQILIEPLATRGAEGLIAFFAACVTRRQPGRVATVFRSETIPPGSRLMLWPDGSVTSNFNDPILTGALLDSFLETTNRRTAIRTLELADRRDAGVLVETIAPPVPLVIFGAGDDAVPLATLAKSIGWHVTVIDARPAFPTVARFPMADAVHCIESSSLESSPEIVFPPTTLAMVMTHSFAKDRELLRFLLARPLKYLGILGPKKRTRHLLDDLGFRHPPACLHGPAGLDIGAETPEEIAVSILSEMQAVLARRGGGALQNRDGPIHDPVDQSLPLP